MGFLDFLKKRQEEKARVREREEMLRREKAEKQRERRERGRLQRKERARERMEKKLREREERVRKREERKRVAYDRIHFWVESRIGIVADLDEQEVRDRLRELLAKERMKGTAPRLHGNKNYDPYAGLEAYIRTNSYRRMLGDHAQSVKGIGVQEETTSDVEIQTVTTTGEESIQRDPRLRELTSAHPSYGRLHFWIEERIGRMDGIDREYLHERLLQLLAEERRNNPPRNRVDGTSFDPCSGLEAYIRSKAYLRMLAK